MHKARPLNSVDSLYKTLATVLKQQFFEPVTIDGIIHSIDMSISKLILQTKNQEKSIECYGEFGSAGLNVGDYIRVKGFVKISPNQNGIICIRVKYFHLVSQESYYQEKHHIYERLTNTLHSPQYQEIIDGFHKKTVPKIITNIAVIVVPGNEEFLEQFKTFFQKNCTGELFVYHLKEVENDFRVALQYFASYHNIDLLCLLAEKITLEHHYNLSSKYNAKFLINRKKIPYLVYVGAVDEFIGNSLVAYLSNIRLDKTDDCIAFIYQLQSVFKKKLDTGIKEGLDLVHQVLAKYQNQLLVSELLVAELSAVPVTNHLDLLKNKLLVRLNQEKERLQDMDRFLMRTILEDPVIKKVHINIVEQQKKPTIQKIENKFLNNDLTDQTNNIPHPDG